MKKAPRRKNNLGHIKGGGEVFNQSIMMLKRSQEKKCYIIQKSSQYTIKKMPLVLCVTLLMQYLMHQLRLQLHIHSQLQSYEWSPPYSNSNIAFLKHNSNINLIAKLCLPWCFLKNGHMSTLHITSSNLCQDVLLVTS